jgi:ubiquinone/menaquinone biosynthesis C-methylase UbiE
MNTPDVSKPDAAQPDAAQPDAAQIGRFRERIRQQWDDVETVAAWRKWGRRRAQTFSGITRALVEATNPRPGNVILDLASGAGQPALALAAAVAPNGHVVATDMSAGMLAVVEDNARLDGLTNLQFRQADAEALPFPDASFDAVTCRFGVMFFPQPLVALRECLRVLRPGGRAVFVVWGSPQQFMFSTTAGILGKYVDMPKPEPGAPHVFRFAEPLTLARVFMDAGFVDVHENALKIACEAPITPADFWEEFREVAAPFRPLIAGLPPDRRAQLDADVLEAMEQSYDGKRLRFHALVNLATGARARA